MSQSSFDYLDSLDQAVQDSYEEVSQEMEVYSNEHGNGFPGGPGSKDSENSPSTYQPQKMNARHREIIRLHALGYKGTEIAGTVGCTPQLVYMVVNSPMGEAFLDEIEQARTGSVQDVRKRLQEMSPLAAELILDIMNDGKKESNRLRAGIKVLEMTGQKPGDTVYHNHTHLTKSDIEDIKKEHSGGPPVHKEFNETNHEVSENDISKEAETQSLPEPETEETNSNKTQ